MMPVYRHTDSYPHQRHQNLFPNYPSNPPTMPYEPSWPHSGFYGYPPMMPISPSCPYPVPYSPVPYHPMYYLPPPYYSSEPPRFEYEKRVPWNQEQNHCCGCPNHDHQGDPRENGTRVVWVPEEYLKEKRGRSSEAEPERVDSPLEKERNGFDGDGKAREEKECSFPIVWMPSWDTMMRQKDEKDANVSSAKQKPDDLPYLFNFLPMKRILNEGDPKKENERSAPQKNESEKPKPDEAKIGESKGSEAEGNKKPSQPPKSSKLPPICLRVDPLPKKKKSGNGSSRSPSPPREKGNDTRKSLNEDNPVAKNMDPKVIAVTEKGGDQQQVCVERANAKPSETKPDQKAVKDDEKMPSKNKPDQNAVKDDEKMPSEYEPDQKAVKDDEKTRGLGKKTMALSDVEAAVRIQSAYRGFEIRRSQPLKKLRLIREVRDQVVDVRDRIRALESSCDNKQKLIIGETIMRLLLQLDTIQGLHPSLREIRKSLAKELVLLQEKLDSLAIEPVEPKSEAFSSRPVAEEDIVVEPKQEQPESDISSADVPSQDIQVDREEPSSETTIEREEEVRDVIAEEPMGKALELEKSSEVPLEEEPAMEPETMIDLEGKTPMLKLGGDGPTEANVEDIKEAELGNFQKAQSVITSEVTSQEEVVGGADLQSESKGTIETLTEAERLGETGEYNPAAVETLEKEDERSESPVPILIESQNSSEKHSEEAEVKLFTVGHESRSCSDKEQAEEEPVVVVSAEPEIKKEDPTEEEHESDKVSAEPELVIKKEESTEEEHESDKVLAEPELEMDSNKKRNKAEEIAKENEKLREMMEKLLEAGKEQMSVISTLSSKVNDLEKKLSRRNNKKKPRTNRRLKDRAVCIGM